MAQNFTVVTMTPDLASSWLAKPWTRRRRVSLVTVLKYATAMREGRWREPSLDPIALTPEGQLLNGHHRLNAVIEAGWTGDMLVALDVDPEVFSVIDTGRARAASQFVQAPSANAVTSSARLVLWYNERWPAHPRGRALTFDNDRLLAYIDEHGEPLAQAVRDASIVQRQSGLPAKPSAAVIYIARELRIVPEERIESWLAGVATGAYLAPDDPRLQLRNRLRSEPARTRSDSAAMWGLTVRAFNAYIQGRSLAKLVWDPNDSPPRIETRQSERERNRREAKRGAAAQPATPVMISPVAG